VVRCDKLQGLEAAIQGLVGAGWRRFDASRILCQDVNFAREKGVLLGQVSKGVRDDKNLPMNFEPGSPFDFDSIMMYSSYVFTEDSAACHADVKECVMARKEMVNGVSKLSHIIRAQVPSSHDVEFVRKYYPWVGWSDGHGPRAPIAKGANMA
jgi:hypothetical protein